MVSIVQTFLGSGQESFLYGLRGMCQNHWVERLWQKDPTLWKNEPEHQGVIGNRLGWLDVASTIFPKIHEVSDWAEKVQKAGFTHVLLLGMGGSSLCPAVCHSIFGSAPGYLHFDLLDTTDPDTILALERTLPLKTTLFIVSSKSGTTLETECLYRYFYHQLLKFYREAGGRENTILNTGRHFVAITDRETPLATEAEQKGFQKIWINPSDVGGRFSGLSFFGLVPMALMGIDLPLLAERTLSMINLCHQPLSPEGRNLGAYLGALWGVLSQSGRSKLTFLTSPKLLSFGLWAEQLIAECLGKEQKGLLPVVDEPVKNSSTLSYQNDRSFILLDSENDPLPKEQEWKKALCQAEHPFIHIRLSDPFDLGAALFAWEVAVAIAGASLGINAFDEPNIKESKDNTAKILQAFQSHHEFPMEPPAARTPTLFLYSNSRLEVEESRSPEVEKSRSREVWKSGNPEVQTMVHNFLKSAVPPAYLALLAYVPYSEEFYAVIQEIRAALRDRLGIPVLFGYGPRYLHSTGQIFKGGPPLGLFIQFTCNTQNDLSVPHQPYTFGTLKQAQALGDWQALGQRNRPGLRFHFLDSPVSGLRQVLQWIE